MRIEIWSDVVCPWCFIGKRRLEKALGAFPHSEEVEVVWRSFQLDPGAPETPVESVAEHLGRKYGGGAKAGQAMIDQVEAVAAEEGLVYRLGQARRVGTLTAHRLLHLALEEAGPVVQGRLKEALLSAYFLRAEDVADRALLRGLAVEVGLDEARVDAVLAGDEYAEAVHADQERAGALGATGVPFAVVDGRYAIGGAQPVEVVTGLLERAWAESHPVLQVVGRGGADACGPDGCAI